MAAVDLCLIANARLPSERAQSLQVVQMAAAFERAGARTALVHAARRTAPPLPSGQDLFAYYAVPPGPRPDVRAVACIDWIDRLPRALQFLPARAQELSFSRNAAALVRSEAPRARVYAREIEVARALASADRAVFLEIHRVPGGRLRRRWLLQAAARSRGIVAISGGVKEDLVRLGIAAASIAVEHDASEAARFAAPGADAAREARRAARERLGLSADARVVVYTGGLLEWKGVDLLVEAARALPELCFVIAGGMAADVERLRARASGIANVRIDGFQPPARVADYLVAGDLGVVPNRSTPAISARYTSPLKVFEAMACGLPLVASDLPAMREILEHESDALLVPPDDARALAGGIRRLADDAALRDRLRARSLARAPAHTWDARARRLLRWMDERAGSP